MVDNVCVEDAGVAAPAPFITSKKRPSAQGRIARSSKQARTTEAALPSPCPPHAPHVWDNGGDLQTNDSYEDRENICPAVEFTEDAPSTTAVAELLPATLHAATATAAAAVSAEPLPLPSTSAAEPAVATAAIATQVPPNESRAGHGRHAAPHHRGPLYRIASRLHNALLSPLVHLLHPSSSSRARSSTTATVVVAEDDRRQQQQQSLQQRSAPPCCTSGSPVATAATASVHGHGKGPERVGASEPSPSQQPSLQPSHDQARLVIAVQAGVTCVLVERAGSGTVSGTASGSAPPDDCAVATSASEDSAAVGGTAAGQQQVLYCKEDGGRQAMGTEDLNLECDESEVLAVHAVLHEEGAECPSEGGSSCAASVQCEEEDEESEGKAVAPVCGVAVLSCDPLLLGEEEAECDEVEEVEEEEEEEHEEVDPLVFIHSLPPLASLVPLHRAVLLPPQTRSCQRKTLVLDLDETLVHSSLERVTAGCSDFTFPVLFNSREHTVYVRQRPYMKEFMQRVAALFEVVVFTASQKVYADQLLNMIDPERRLIRHRVFRDSCVEVAGNYLKDLSVLGRDLRCTLIVDNSPQAFGFQIDNGVPIESWYDDDGDQELLHLLPFLESLVDVEDVRPHIQERYRLKERIMSAAAAL